MKKIVLLISIILSTGLLFISLIFFSSFLKMEEWNLSNIIFKNNLKNTIAIVLAGIGFGISGYITQSIVKNNLATPSTIGITPVITLAIILSTIFGFTIVNKLIFSIFVGLIFAIVAITIIRKSHNAPMNIIIFGIILTGIVYGINQIVINIYNVPRYISTLLSQNKPIISWSTIYIIMPILLFSSIVLFILSPKIKIIEQGDNHSRNLGINTKLIIPLSWFFVIVICVSSLLLVGMILFASLASPLLVRYVFRIRNIYLGLLISIMFSIIFILAGDILVRYKSYYTIALVPTFVSSALITGKILWK